MSLQNPTEVKNYLAPVEGQLVRDIFVGSARIDFFHTETSFSENGVGRDVSQGVLAYQAGTPVLLATEMTFPDGHKLGYFMVGGRQPVLMADLKAFQAVAWDVLMAKMEAQHLKDREALGG